MGKGLTSIILGVSDYMIQPKTKIFQGYTLTKDPESPRWRNSVGPQSGTRLTGTHEVAITLLHFPESNLWLLTASIGNDPELSALGQSEKEVRANWLKAMRGYKKLLAHF